MSVPLSLCVYCGARPGASPAFINAAKEMGAAIARENWRLVYGAGDAGIMGTVAKHAIDGGAEALGVIPTHLLQREAPNRQFGQRIITETMHERKKVMFMNADAIVVLPGGAGSLDEFFEVLTWAQLGLHKKPIFLLNIDGYWTPLIQLLDHIIAQEFAYPSLLDLIRSVPDVPSLVSALRAGAD